jgi:hypothetical protein
MVASSAMVLEQKRPRFLYRWRVFAANFVFKVLCEMVCIQMFEIGHCKGVNLLGFGVSL